MERRNKTANNELSNQAKEAKNAYQRAWAKKNRDKVREIQKRYWEKKVLQTAGMKNESKE